MKPLTKKTNYHRYIQRNPFTWYWKNLTDTTQENITHVDCKFLPEICNYLLVYEYCPDFGGDAWTAFKRGLATKAINTEDDDEEQDDEEEQEKKRTKKNHNKTLLLGGRRDGSICVFDWLTGKVTFKIDVSIEELEDFSTWNQIFNSDFCFSFFYEVWGHLL